MSKKNSKTSFRSFFPKRGSVMPIDDEEATSSQNSQHVPKNERNVNNPSFCVDGTVENQSIKRDNFMIITNEKIRDSSKSSLPNSFSEKTKSNCNALLQFGSQTVKSIVTPPRYSSFPKIEDNFQELQQAINPPCSESNNNNNNDNNICCISSNGSNHDVHHEIKVTSSRDSANEMYCRICHDNPSKWVLVSPCLCKGTMGMIHLYCLERWLGESGKNSCEICGYEYVTKRRPKYFGCRSLFNWLRHPLSPADTRNFVFDLACFCILTPLAAVSAWLCVLGAQHYTFGQETQRIQSKRQVQQYENVDGLSHNDIKNRSIQYPDEASNSTWTSVGLLTLTGTLLSAYIVWLVVAFRFHLQVYRDWQTKNFIVTIVPMSVQEHAFANEIRDTETAMMRSCIGHGLSNTQLFHFHENINYPVVFNYGNDNNNESDSESTPLVSTTTSTPSEETGSEIPTPNCSNIVEREMSHVELESEGPDDVVHRVSSSPN